jgi:hypothetical protein
MGWGLVASPSQGGLDSGALGAGCSASPKPAGIAQR